MKRPMNPLARMGLPLALALWMLAGALPASEAATANEQRQAEPVSATPPEVPPFSSKIQPLRELPEVPSRGGCEPRYRNGMSGTCINDKPCRGFGIEDPAQGAICACFERIGGCAEDERCERRGAQCVKDDATAFDPVR